EEAVHAVAVVLVVLRGVDAALRGDAVRAARRVVEREELDVVTELTEGRGCGRPGAAAADDGGRGAALVRGVDELDVELVLVPLLRDRALRDLGLKRTDHDVWSTPLRRRGLNGSPLPSRSATACSRCRRGSRARRRRRTRVSSRCTSGC